MSAVYNDVRTKAVLRQAGGFATMYDEPAESAAGANSVYSSSSLGQYVGSAFITGAAVLYAWHGEPNEMGDRQMLRPIQSENIFPLVGQTHTGTMSIGGAWVAAEPDVYSSGVVNLPWARKIIFSGKVQFKTAQLARRKPRTIIGDFADEGNG